MLPSTVAPQVFDESIARHGTAPHGTAPHGTAPHRTAPHTAPHIAPHRTGHRAAAPHGCTHTCPDLSDVVRCGRIAIQPITSLLEPRVSVGDAKACAWHGLSTRRLGLGAAMLLAINLH